MLIPLKFGRCKEERTLLNALLKIFVYSRSIFASMCMKSYLYIFHTSTFDANPFALRILYPCALLNPPPIIVLFHFCTYIYAEPF